jgi:hypothetical protein
MTEAVPPFRTFVERLQDMTRTVIVRNSSKHGGLTLPAYLHFAMPDGQHDTQHVGMGQTLMGEWLPWPPNQQAGTFVTPIQEALR